MEVFRASGAITKIYHMKFITLMIKKINFIKTGSEGSFLTEDLSTS